MPDKPRRERRYQARAQAELAVRVRSSRNSGEVTGKTRDLSTNGVFFYTQSPILEGSELEIILMLPPEMAEGKKQWVCCRAAVVRVEKNVGSAVLGVAASIHNMQVLPEILP